MEQLIIIDKPAARTEREIYRDGSSITVTYDHLPGNDNDRIVVARKGSLGNVSVHRHITGGDVSGSYRLPVLERGEYELRLFINYTNSNPGEPVKLYGFTVN